MPLNIEPLVETILKEIGEDPSREGLKRTPARVARALEEMTAGYKADIDAIFNGAFFTVPYREMVVVKDIAFHSMCEHHMLPFTGKVHVAYIPDHTIVGLSKIPRLVDAFARRLQLQERLTIQIAETLERKLKPKGVGVIIEARHMCMTMRGAKNETSLAVTSSLLGCFGSDPKVRQEFLALAGPGGH